MPDSSPAFLSVAFLQPVINALEHSGVSTEDMARELAIREVELRDPSVQVAANAIYQFLAWATRILDDRYFCVEIGRKMGRGEWAPILPLFQSARSVADFLFQFSMMSEQQGPAASYRLEVLGSKAVWRLTRPKEAVKESAFADAIAVGFFLELFHRAAGESGDQCNLTVSTSDASLIPETLLPAQAVISGARGMFIRFPTAWLSLEMPVTKPAVLPATVVPRPSATPPDLSKRVRTLLQDNLHNPSFGLKELEDRLGINAWRLQAGLRAADTSLKALKAEIRQDQALSRLTETDQPVSQIASDLGYTDRSNFTRAFRAWTGISPSQFREENTKTG